ncbi:MAG: hypothetical protein ACR2NH_00615 [Solirubrobacteraceae bacterium]
MATSSRATAGDPGRVERLSTAAAGVRWFDVVRIGLGALFVNVVFENVHKDLYTEDGGSRLIESYIARNRAPEIWRDFMQVIADGYAVLGPLQAAFELSLGILLVLGLARGLVALAATGHLFALWLSEVGIFWLWEVMIPTLAAAALALATLPHLLDRRLPVVDRILGPPTFGSLPLLGRAAIAVAGGFALWLATRAVGPRPLGKEFGDVAIQSGVLFGILLLICALIDQRRPEVSEVVARPAP